MLNACFGLVDEDLIVWPANRKKACYGSVTGILSLFRILKECGRGIANNLRSEYITKYIAPKSTEV
jgi:hypothetical protein